jgi:hypothetical protein
VLSSEEILNHNKPRKTRKKRDKTIPRKEKNDKETKEEQQSPEIKKLFPEPIIYDPYKNQRNIQLVVDDNNNFKPGTPEQITRDAKEITNYYLEFHKYMVNTYNSIYSQMLKNISNLYLNNFFTISGTFTNYPSEIKNMYNSLGNKRDQSLKLIDNIITENLDTFIKSIELVQRFYKDVFESYLNCIKKVEQ